MSSYTHKTIQSDPLEEPKQGGYSSQDSRLAERIVRRLFARYPYSMSISLWDGHAIRIGHQDPAFSLLIKHPRVLRDVVLFHDPVRMAEAYFEGDIDVSGDFNAAVKLRYYLESLQLSWQDKLVLLMDALLLHYDKISRNISDSISGLASNQARPIPVRDNSQQSIAFHYDVSNEFYRLWLDSSMVYSCAYYDAPQLATDQSVADISLEMAQAAKLDHVCRKLRLQAGDSILDIGCGWGALACWAAKNYGVHVHGITLSRNQHDYAQQQVQQQGLQGLVTIELRDYRELPADARYDKVVSIGMFEHVGLKNLALYFDTVHRVLKPGGIFLNHGITSDSPGWDSGVSTRFINRHVFPDGELDTISNIQQRMESAKFEIADVESLRPHYALTLREWVRRLEANKMQAIASVGERTYRVWRLYMTGCALQFEDGVTAIYQILAVRKDGGLPELPLSRRDIYSADAANHKIAAHDALTSAMQDAAASDIRAGLKQRRQAHASATLLGEERQHDA